MVKLVLVLGDQLSPDLSALVEADKSEDVVVMAETVGEARYVPHHPKKIAFIFAAMRKFAARLREDGWTVEYFKYGEDDAPESLTAALLDRAEAHGAGEVITTEAGEWRVIKMLEELPLQVRVLPDDRFIATHAEFETWAEGRKACGWSIFTARCGAKPV